MSNLICVKRVRPCTEAHVSGKLHVNTTSFTPPSAIGFTAFSPILLPTKISRSYQYLKRIVWPNGHYSKADWGTLQPIQRSGSWRSEFQPNGEMVLTWEKPGFYSL